MLSASLGVQRIVIGGAIRSIMLKISSFHSNVGDKLHGDVRFPHRVLYR